MRVNLTTACYPGLPMRTAVERVIAEASSGGGSDPAVGLLVADEIQLCPQNTGRSFPLTLDDIGAIRERVSARLRLHANVAFRGRESPLEVARFNDETRSSFEAAGRLSSAAGAQAYTLHSGLREHAQLEELPSKLLAIEDCFGIPVGVEGQYPAAGQPFLIDTWDEYAWLLSSGMRYAVDLSHLNIVRVRSRRHEPTLVQELLASERCIEIHISDNLGSKDAHLPFSAPARFVDPSTKQRFDTSWALACLADPSVNREAVIFYEGRLG